MVAFCWTDRKFVFKALSHFLYFFSFFQIDSKTFLINLFYFYNNLLKMVFLILLSLMASFFIKIISSLNIRVIFKIIKIIQNLLYFLYLLILVVFHFNFLIFLFINIVHNILFNNHHNYPKNLQNSITYLKIFYQNHIRIIYLNLKATYLYNSSTLYLL